jgi:TonB-linked SusC/RagA family outer membrane protein
MKRAQWWSAILLALALLPSAAWAQQRGTITGQVLDVGSQQPLRGVQVFLANTSQGTLTDAQGRYQITNVPAGPQTVRATLIGYTPASQTVTVTEGGTATVDFQLAASAVALEGVIVTATGETQRRREVGASVASVNIADVELAPVTNVSQLLQGRAAGVVVLPSSGTSGTGSRIRIRGSNSISLSNEPLLVIDGVRVENDAESFSFGLGGQSISRLNDLSPENIERIDVLKGPAASALYGTAAANGVIVVTTKQGRAGRTAWRAWTEQGSVVEPTHYPDNVRNIGTLLTGANAGATTTNCNIISQATGVCRPDSLVVFNPLEQNSPFRDGWRQTYGVSANGGGDRATYFLSGDWQNEEGVYHNNVVRRVNLRANVTANLLPDLTATVSSGYITGRTRLPYNDNAVEGFIGGGLLGNPTTVASTGGYFSYPKERREAFDLEQTPQRFTGSVNSTWTPLEWLNFIGTAGMDVQNLRDTYTILPGIFSPDEDADYTEGQRQVNAVRTRNYSANISGNTNYTLSPVWTGSTSIGAQYSREAYHRSDAFGQGLLPGTKSLNAASKLFSIGEVNQEVVTVGAFAQQQATWRDRVYLSAALRGDDNSSFGQDFGLVWYPSFNASWVVDEEPFFPENSVLSTLRLRAAWGESGLQPTFRAATTFFQPVSAVRNAQDVPAFTVGGTGNANLKPERSREIEAGFDAGFFDRRVSLEATYYDKRSTDALVLQVLAPSLGATRTRWANIGKVSNRGFEGLLNVNAVQTEPVEWNFTVTAQTNRNRLVDLGGIEPIIFGLGGNTQRHTEGRPLGAYFDRPILSFSDANGDGIIGPDEVVVGDTAVYLGTPFPTREISFNTDLTLMRWIRIAALIDHKGGQKLYNGTEDFRCAAVLVCDAIQNQDAPLADQARAVADRFHGTVAGYIEDASFTKLRELSVTFTAPDQWLRSFGASALSLTLSGRNLKTWTDYTGLDPEINFGGQANFSTAEFLTQPAVRYYIARVDVSF